MLCRNRLVVPGITLLGSVLHPWGSPPCPWQRNSTGTGSQRRRGDEPRSVAVRERQRDVRGCEPPCNPASCPAQPSGGGAGSAGSGEKVGSGAGVCGCAGSRARPGSVCAAPPRPRSVTPGSAAAPTAPANSVSANAFRSCAAGNKERNPCLQLHSYFSDAWRPFFYPEQLRDIS